MKSPLRTALMSAALAVVCFAASVASAAHSVYQLTVIGPGPTVTPYQSVFVADLNDKGELVGAIGSNPNAFLWRNGTLTDLGNLGSSFGYAEATGINNRSEIVGISLDPENRFRGFFWRDGQLTDLGTFPDAAAVFTHGINWQRQIVGSRYDNLADDSLPFVQQGTQTRTLDALPGGGARYPARINEIGVVAGGADASTGERHAVIWLGKYPIDLGQLPNSSQTTANGLNDWVQVVGTSSGSTHSTAWRWQFGGLSPLPSLHDDPDWGTTALDINNRGQIVGGEFSRTSGQKMAVLWDDNEPLNLNDFVDDADPLKPHVTLHEARLINNRGQIVATGVDSRAPNFANVRYLLTPIGE